MGFVPPIVALNIAHSDMQHLPENLMLADADFDWVHFDVADGNYVPRLTFGAPVLAFARRFSQATFDAHLMCARPARLVGPLCAAGANLVTIHPDTTDQPRELLRAIRNEGVRAGIALCPKTHFESVRRLLPEVDLVSVLTSGMEYDSLEFQSELLARVRSARELRARERLTFLIKVEGGLTLQTVAAAREAGADVYVVGGAVFASSDPAYTLATFRAAVRGETLSGSQDGVTSAQAPKRTTQIFRRRRAA